MGALVIPAVARAEGARFGGAGQLAISDDQPLGGVAATEGITPIPPLSFSSASFQFASVDNNGGSGTEFTLAPAADYFVIENLSIGGNVVVGVLSPAHGSNGSGPSETIFGIAPRVGYNVPIGDSVSFWPKLFFAYTSASESNPSASANMSAIGVYAPFMFRPAPHFFLGIGPNFSTQLSSNETVGNLSTSGAKVTQVGLQATIGGWLLGD
jgi:hypothetical protein